MSITKNCTARSNTRARSWFIIEELFFVVEVAGIHVKGKDWVGVRGG
jgi:hypothetical protein